MTTNNGTNNPNNKWVEWTDLIKLGLSENYQHKNNLTAQQITKKHEQCKYCNNEFLQEDHMQGHISCDKCGCVNEFLIEDTAEWRNKTDAHTYSGDAVRCAPIDDLLPKLSLSTKLVPVYGSKFISQEMRIARLNQWQSGDPLERAIKVDFDFIDDLFYNKKFALPRQVLYITKQLFKEFYIASYEDSQSTGSKRDCLRGQSRKGMIGVCMYFSSKIYNIHCTKEYIADILDTDALKIRKARQVFFNTMQSKIVDIDLWNNSIAKISNVSDFICAYQIALQLPHYITGYTTALYKYIKPTRVLSSKQPQSIAATFVWIVVSHLNTHITIEDIVTKCCISKATVKDIIQRVSPYINEALLVIFTKYACDKLSIENVITVNKITQVSCCINKLPIKHGKNHKISQKDIDCAIGVAIYFVLVIKDISPDITLKSVMTICNVTQPDFLNMITQVMNYKQALIKRFID